MANLCFWEAYIRGERCKEVVDIMKRDYKYVGTGKNVVDYAMKYVAYRNLNKKKRKYIDSLNYEEKFKLLKRIHRYVNDPVLNIMFRDRSLDIDDFKYWLDNFPGLVIKKPVIVEGYEYVTEDKEPHMFGVSDVECVEQADDLLFVSGCCRWDVYESMLDESRYYSNESPYALNLSDIMKKCGTDITIRAIESSCGICEILEVNKYGEIVQDECLDYNDLFEKSYDDFENDEEWRMYSENIESEFYEGLKFLQP